MRHLILTLSLILGATSVSANDRNFAVGDVFFCKMEEFVEWVWDQKKLLHYKQEKFKFNISDRNTLQFGQGGFLNNVKLSISYLGTDILYAGGDYIKMTLDGGNLSYTTSSFDSPILIAATCDRF